MNTEKCNNNHRNSNPRETASFLSQIAFCWTLPLFIKGYQKDLNEADLYAPLKQHSSNKLGNRLEKEWKIERLKQKPSLLKALARIFGAKFAMYGILAFVLEGVRICQPVFLHYLLEYFKTGQTTISESEAYMYASFILLVAIIKFIGGHHTMFQLQQFGMKIRIACGSLIYRKVLRLSKKAMGETTTGQIVNILANDMSRFDRFVLHAHNLWIAPLQVVIVFYLMYVYLGIVSTIGVGIMALYIPLQMYLARQMSKMRLKTAHKTDERVRFMNEIINGIQVIKMYTWEEPFAKLVEHARRLEVKYIRYKYYIRGFVVLLSILSSQFTIFITILTYVLLGNNLTADYVFVMYSFFDIQRQCLTKHFPFAISEYADIKVSMGRIQKFLLYHELDRDEDGIIRNGISGALNKETLKIVKGTAKWSEHTNENTLNNINISVRDELLAVIGPVGCGKSSLLQVILKELPLVEGVLNCHGTISYAAQEPWLFGATVRQNILFGQTLDLKRYNKVIKACALEQDIATFPYGDETLVGERGIMVSGGQKARINLARAIYKDSDIYLLDDPLSAVDTHVGKRLFEECILNFLKDKTVILVTHQLQYLKNINHIILMDRGEIIKEGNYNDIAQLNCDFANTLTAETNEDVMDNKPIKDFAIVNETKGHEQQLINETRNKGKIKRSVYGVYIKSWGSFWFTGFLGIIFIASQVSQSGSDYFLSYWVNSEQKRTENNSTYLESDALSRETCVYIYTGVILSTLILAVSRCQAYFKMVMDASIKLHDQMFASILFVPMKFFHDNTSGRILNRFSKDTGYLDEHLPMVLLDTIQVAMQFTGISIMVGLVNPLFFFITGIIIVISYLLRIVYLSTSRDIKRLEATCKSPVFTHVSATLQGLTTIRAFDAQTILIEEFDNYQNRHSAAWFMLLFTSRTFGFYLDTICSIYIGLVIFSFLVLGTETYQGNVGLAITQSLSLTGICQWGMRQWSELENQMTSVERINEYVNLDHERKDDGAPLSKNKWLTQGKVEFKSVYLRYSINTPYVLKHLSFAIGSEEKIGIVGRTGAGKSSLIAALFQLTGTEGDILIDDVNISDVSLKELRSNISIIPQEPVLFSGTMRKNLDPFDEFQDVDLWSALEEVELKSVIADLPSGLNARMMEGGSNFSVGQRQLICLARAIVRKNKVLVLDEATANVDLHTDSLIQQTIRKKFSSCTVLTIAHRLNTIMDSDKVMVLDDGVLVEFNHPHLLLQNKEGVFTAMLQQTAKNMAEGFREMAEQAYKQKMNGNN